MGGFCIIEGVPLVRVDDVVPGFAVQVWQPEKGGFDGRRNALKATDKILQVKARSALLLIQKAGVDRILAFQLWMASY